MTGWDWNFKEGAREVTFTWESECRGEASLQTPVGRASAEEGSALTEGWRQSSAGAVHHWFSVPAGRVSITAGLCCVWFPVGSPEPSLKESS